jgi:hypothetical protein
MAIAPQQRMGKTLKARFRDAVGSETENTKTARRRDGRTARVKQQNNETARQQSSEAMKQ